jgi:hypothetical protein
MMKILYHLYPLYYQVFFIDINQLKVYDLMLWEHYLALMVYVRVVYD